MSPKISVVIPSYNKSGYIKETLLSIMNQDYTNFEVIIQDGASTDGTLEIIEEIVKKNPQISLESMKDAGQLDAINKGFKKSTGEILTFINADDVYEVGAFRAVANAYNKKPDSLWFAGSGVVVNEKGVEIVSIVTFYKNCLLFLNSYFLLLISNYLMQPSVFISRKAYEKHGPFAGTEDFVMEYDLWLKLGKVQMPTVVNINLSKFRIEPGSKTKRLFRKLLLEDYKIASKYTKNRFILMLHSFHNFGRLLVENFI